MDSFPYYFYYFFANRHLQITNDTEQMTLILTQQILTHSYTSNVLDVRSFDITIPMIRMPFLPAHPFLPFQSPLCTQHYINSSYHICGFVFFSFHESVRSILKRILMLTCNHAHNMIDLRCAALSFLVLSKCMRIVGRITHFFCYTWIMAGVRVFRLQV
jgi:hypothetical protein